MGVGFFCAHNAQIVESYACKHFTHNLHNLDIRRSQPRDTLNTQFRREVFQRRQEAMEKQFRHECKHEISYGDYLALRRRLLPVMRHDPHTTADGLFIINKHY